MDDLSGDELVVLILSFIAAGWTGLRYLGPLLTTDKRSASWRLRALLLAAPVGGLCFLHSVLVRWAEAQVRAQPVYILLFMLLGGAWLGAVLWLLPLVGLSFRDDALDRANPAAAIVLCGALLGTSVCYAGCNIGGGETIWSTILPALIATGVLMLLWFVVELTSGVADAITIDRDVASALRLAAWIVAAGAVLGRAMAGDYVTAEATSRDFVRQGWPAGILALATIVMQRAFGATPVRPKPAIISTGLAPALVMLLLAAGWIVSLGAWTVNGSVR